MATERTTEEKRNEVLSYVVNYINEFEYPPTINEILDDVQISSKSVVNNDLEVLDKEGSIRRDERGARAIKVTLYPSPIEFPKKYDVYRTTEPQTSEE